jgi:UDP-glucose 4-epimerase
VDSRLVEKILITGCAGFVGSHLYRYLTGKGYEVTGIDNFMFPIRDWHKICGNIIYWDVAGKFSAEGGVFSALPFKERFDCLIHLAAQISVDYSLEEPWSSLHNNIVGTLNMLEYCRLTDTPMIYASSCEVLGSNQYPDRPMDESHPCNPASPYGYSKLIGELLCKSYYKTYGLKVNIMRPFNIYGPHQRESDYGGAIAKFTRRALNNQPPEIYGDGMQTRDYVYIDDIVRAYELAVNADFKGEPINFGSGREVTINELAELILKLTGRTGLKPVHVKPRPNEVRRSWCNPKRARELLGWEPKVTLEEGLRRYVEWRVKLEG